MAVTCLSPSQTCLGHPLATKKIIWIVVLTLRFFFFFFLGMKKQRPKAPDPGAFAMWMVGRDRFGTNKSSQKKKATK